MLITEQTRYLVVPTSQKAEVSKIYIKANGKLLLDLDSKVDFKEPETVFYYDLRHFFGKDIEISNSLGKELGFSKIAAEYADEYRPHIHLTARQGWINDPNGLCFYEGKYHAFFQHNPVGLPWGNMHWGHAVSRDLVNWEDLGDALIPDEMGDMYSGSAIVDHDNILGLKVNEHDPLILFYTAAGDHREISKGKQFTQCMAYSTDGGYTFTKWKNNPIVPHIKGGNRDPKVIRDPRSGVYVMALYLDSDEYGLLTSSNLLDWKLIQTVNINGDAECPDFYPLYSDDGSCKWVFGGAHDCAIIGDFDIEKGFYNMSEPVKFGFGRPYAAQSFTLPDNSRRIRMAWNKYNGILSKQFRCELGIPCDVTLKDGKLGIFPIPELDSHFNNTQTYEKLPSHGVSFELSLPCDITFEISKCEEPITINLFENEFKLDPNGILTVNGKEQMPLTASEGFKFRMIADTCGTEIFDSLGCAYGAFELCQKGNIMTVGGEGSLDKLILKTVK